MNIQPLELPLFTEEKILTPLTQVLEHAVPQLEEIPKLSGGQNLKTSLDELFPEQKYEEKSIQKAKEILGSISKELNADELKTAVIEIQFLAETWLDDFERSIFKGKTLNELLHEKGKL